ncbi:MAG: cob(I)yrinic acid a,c-diamide adenosyltransferase [Patescibacteria group bacterium]|mgnify:CR=1 FL=1
MKIYTKTGDEGDTSLLGGKRISKCCIEMRVIGETDELNASLGLVVSELERGDLKNFILEIQKNLFKAGSEIASLQTDLQNIEKIGQEKITELEKMIDKLCTELPELKNFVLPGGCRAGALLHQTRAICRRAERELVAFGKSAQIRPELYAYFNRLSDFFFTAARWINFRARQEEMKA